MRFTKNELNTLEWLAHYGQKIAEENKNSIMTIHPVEWSDDLNNACKKLLEEIEAKHDIQIN